jgi:hypothetical protein
MTLAQYGERFPQNQGLTLLAADVGVAHQVYTGSNTPSRVDAVLCTNSDSIDHILEFSWQPLIGATVVLGSVNIPARQGYANTPPLDVVPILLPHGGSFVCAGGDLFIVTVVVAPTGVTHVDLLALGGNL